MVETGNPNSVTDAGVGAIAARSAVLGAFLNVKVNAAGYTDTPWTEKILQEADKIRQKALAQELEIIQLVESKIKG